MAGPTSRLEASAAPTSPCCSMTDCRRWRATILPTGSKKTKTLRVGSPGILGNDTDPDADALTVKDADPSVPVHTASERSEQREADARHRRLIQLQAQAQLPRHRLHQLHSDPRRKRQQRRCRDDQGPVRARVDRRKVDLWHAPTAACFSESNNASFGFDRAW